VFIYLFFVVLICPLCVKLWVCHRKKQQTIQATQGFLNSKECLHSLHKNL